MGTGATYADPTYRLDLSLQAAEGTDTRQLSLTASRRTKLAANFTVSGSVFSDTDDDGVFDGGESGLNNISVNAYDATQSAIVDHVPHERERHVQRFARAAGSYVLCQGLQTNWTGTLPGSSSATPACTSGGYGFVVTPALTTSVTFGTQDPYFGNGGPPTCSNSPVPQALDTSTRKLAGQPRARLLGVHEPRAVRADRGRQCRASRLGHDGRQERRWLPHHPGRHARRRQPERKHRAVGEHQRRLRQEVRAARMRLDAHRRRHGPRDMGQDDGERPDDDGRRRQQRLGEHLHREPARRKQQHGLKVDGNGRYFRTTPPRGRRRPSRSRSCPTRPRTS